MNNKLLFNIINAKPLINTFLSKIPQSQLYFNNTSKIYEKNEIPHSTLIILFDQVTKANNIMLTKIKHEYLYKDFTTWNICITKNVFFNLPFTLGNVIIVPNAIITNGNNFLITLVHEKLHICQRYNKIWDKVDTKKWKKLTDADTKIDFKKLNLTTICNPDIDTCPQNYAYVENGEWYYGIFILKNDKLDVNTTPKELDVNTTPKGLDVNTTPKRLELFWFKLQKNGFHPVDKKIFHKEFEHPYEMFAYEISKKICG